ncbi:hypothetical protein BG53_04345 [Paenibacillus darwinianus]|uniref:Sugar ABC transporter substrate-binding protein n=1 Tax=Paenibacillus darwinianus TaxID=1380763 RepID=A0A9W5S196_9BACL|nr:hypothetical protein [Paenibacillus darwinianus]EXX85176.1 hypothetical protein CH50_10015 [Paenibacillus darwinianus]EXX87347.1 hypothetical protein BG53_04345 [Paenibacillus darwinianus]
MRKSVGIVLVAVLLAGLLSACGARNEQTGSAGETVTLNAIFMKQAGYSEDAINEATKQFMAQNPDIKVGLAE